jgi:hypothetical protein
MFDVPLFIYPSTLNHQPTCHLSPVTRPAGIGLWVLRQKSPAVDKPDQVSGDNR